MGLGTRILAQGDGLQSATVTTLQDVRRECHEVLLQQGRGLTSALQGPRAPSSKVKVAMVGMGGAGWCTAEGQKHAKDGAGGRGTLALQSPAAASYQNRRMADLCDPAGDGGLSILGKAYGEIVVVRLATADPRGVFLASDA